MKKSLFAVAALSAIAGAAQAQSSVTVYGIMDAGYIGSNETLSAGSGSTNPANVKKQSNQFGQSAESTSRLGFKGNEDMGGGTSAFFTIEMGLNPQLGNLSGSSAASSTTYDKQGTTNTSGSAIDNRQSFVGLKKAGVGQIAFGRQYTAVFNSAAATSTGQHNNVIGDVIYAGSTAVTDTYSGQYYLSGFTNRGDNQVSISSDTFAGFKGNAFMTMANANSTATTATGTTAGANSNWNGWGVGADYTWNMLFVTASYQNFRTKIDSSTASTSTAISDINGAGALAGQTLTSMATPATNLTDKQQFVGATYDFGILKAYAQYISRNIYQNTGVAGNTFQRSAEQIGVRSYITPTIEAWASTGMGKVQGNGLATAYSSTIANGGSSKFNAYQLGANYYLSKRTNLYGIFGSTQTTNSVTGISGSGSSANQYALGMRHTF